MAGAERELVHDGRPPAREGADAVPPPPHGREGREPAGDGDALRQPTASQGDGRERDPEGDYLVRAVAGDGRVRAFACRTTNLVEEARRRHDTWPTATAALGRVLTGTALLAAQLKDDASVTVRVTGSGPLGVILAVGETDGSVRGYVRNPHVDLPLRPDGKLDVGGAVGLPGFLHVTRDLGLGTPYTGSVPLVSGEIGDDLTAFLVRSDQTPSVVGVGVLVNPAGEVRAAGGFMLQLLPGHPDDWVQRLEDNIRQLQGISRLIDAGLTPEAMVERGLEGLAPRILDRQPLAFRCRCDRQRVERALLSLGPDQLEAMLREDGGAELRCHFCGTVYRVSADELDALLGRAQEGRAGRRSPEAGA
ncbi:MAG TPA: Hsp33 family molecular chaperone HslO [Thermaerobacter sp.]